MNNDSSDAAAPQWRTTSIPPVDPTRFGKDHWSTFAYVETRIGDHRGTLNHDHMRCHFARHPAMANAKQVPLDGRQYATLLADGVKLADHDDYDCLDDLMAAGLLEVHMPSLARRLHVGEYFVDADDRPITDEDGCLITRDFVTGLTELRLCVHAIFSLTDRGAEVASSLRQHKATGGSFGTFRMG